MHTCVDGTQVVPEGLLIDETCHVNIRDVAVTRAVSQFTLKFGVRRPHEVHHHLASPLRQPGGRLDNKIASLGSDVYETKRCEVHGVGAPPIESQTGACITAHVTTNGFRNALIGER